MAKGATAKVNVVNKLMTTFGSDYIGEFDKKYYVWADDGGEKVQIAISLTCPKVNRGIEETDTGELNFEEVSAAADAPKFQPAAITPQEEETLAELMAKFGL